MKKNKIKKLPLVSVILNCHNGKKYINESIRSVLNQSYENWELIIFDNNSNDNTKSEISKFRDKRIRYFRTNKLYNLYHARNLAIKKSKGKLISFIDADDWWLNNKLELQVKLFLNSKKVEVVYSNLFIFNEIKNKYKIFSRKKLYKGKITQPLINDFKMPILTTILKKDIFKSNQFDKRFNIIGDFDFFVRLSLKKNIISIQEPLAFYRIHSSNLTSKRLDLTIKELEIWLKEKFKNKNYKFFNLKSVCKLIQKLKIRDNLIKGNKFQAFKELFKKPYFISKFKFIFLIFIPKSYIKFLWRKGQEV